jgi:hypothetical protein
MNETTMDKLVQRMDRMGRRVVSIGLFLCVLAPCFVLASSAAEKSPEAVIHIFYKAAREGKYTEARQYFSQKSLGYIKKMKDDGWKWANSWAAIVDEHTKNRTLQTVEVGEVSTHDEVREIMPRDVGEGTVMCSVLARFADGGAQKLSIALVKEGGEWKIYWIGKLEVEQSFRDYVVSIYDQYFYRLSEITNYFEILQGGRRVYMSGFGGGFSSFEFVETDLNVKPNKRIAMGKDITGNGIPNLVVRYHTNRSAGFRDNYIFEIGQKFREIAVIKYSPVNFADLDGDSKLEIVVPDFTFVHFLDSPASYRPPDVILRYQDGAYRIVVDLMQKPAPSREDLERRAQQARKDTHWKGEVWLEHDYVPESLYVPMLELLYSGHTDLAWEFLEMAWPPDISGKDAWLSKFRAELADSQYWPLDSKRAYFVP